MKKKLLAVLLSLLTALFLLSAAIAVPILCKPFYYAQIEPLHIVENSGFSREQIVWAFNETVDFCIGLRPEFSTGELAWSESGRDHFVDVRGLFQLDLLLAAVTGILLLVWAALRRKTALRPYYFLGRGPGFWGSVGLGGAFIVLGGLAALDFDRAFVIFHALFFPGKDNWLFDYRTDQVILILPEEFFRNCAILVLALIVLGCGALIALDFRKKKED